MHGRRKFLTERRFCTVETQRVRDVYMYYNCLSVFAMSLAPRSRKQLSR